MVEKLNLRNKNWSRHVIGILVTVICLVIVLRQINLKDLIESYQNFHWPYLIFAVVSLSIGYVLRIFRWSIMLSVAGNSASWKNCAAPFLGSIALNNVLPLRIGDVVRAIVFPSAMGIGKTVATTSLLMERLIDLMTLLGCLAIGITITQKAHLPPVMVDSVIAMTLLGGGLLIMLFLFSAVIAEFFKKIADEANVADRNELLVKTFTVISNVCHGFDAMSRPRLIFSTVFISVFIWAGESGLFYFILKGFGFDASLGLGVIVMAIATLSTLVPSSPGYIGPFHLATYTAVSMLGGTAAQAGSVAILAHLTLWLPTTIAGVIAILTRPALFQSVRSKPV